MESIASHLTRARPTFALSSWRSHVAELALYAGFYLLYLLLRGLVFAGDGHALANTELVIALEKSLGFYHEPSIQAWALANARPLVVTLNWVYIITYWPIILGAALALYLTRHHIYCRYRNLIVTHLALALILFVLFPLAPPFKTGGLADTIQLLGPAFYGSESMAVLYNTNAAMPSLHFSWTCIFAWLFVVEARGWYRFLGVCYPLLTLAAIIITGNHFFLDAVVGALLIPVAYGVGTLSRKWTRKLNLTKASG